MRAPEKHGAFSTWLSWHDAVARGGLWPLWHWQKGSVSENLFPNQQRQEKKQDANAQKQSEQDFRKGRGCSRDYGKAEQPSH
jgi:hypothetical protein